MEFCFLYFTDGHAGFYIRIDKSIGRFTPEIFLQYSSGIHPYSHVLFGGIKPKLSFGEMAEWLIAPVLKTGIVSNKELSRVRIPLSPFFSLNRFVSIGFARIGIIKKEKWLGYPT